MFSNKMTWAVAGSHCLGTGWALVDGEQFSSLVFLGVYFSSLLSFCYLNVRNIIAVAVVGTVGVVYFLSVVEVFLSQTMTFLTFTLSVLFLLRGK